ncbi:MAG: TetR family transcriptional regulator C-terminal domain-containing protein [Betaproteobacteria bacterium]|nr:TetR family transcriptional regulator C-terminal domain-containing protein [Betaproteobacteria bacterium]
MEPARQADLTRQRILEAGYAEILRHGFQAASVASILVDTGLTKGALYHHFPSKKDLGLAVVEEVIRGYLNTVMFLPLRMAERPLAGLLALLDSKLAITEEALRFGCPLNNLMQEMSPVDEDFRAALNGVLCEWQDAIRDTLLRAQGAGEVRTDVDCHAAALFIVSAWEGCTGIAKNMQSIKTFSACMSQLRAYVVSLTPP